jgi:hypothetical protein
MADRWELTIPGYFPPSLNRTQMAHWSSVRRHKKRALEMVHIYGLQAGGLPRFTGPVKVTVTRLWGKRQRAWDIDNLYGAVKPLVDALRAEHRNTMGKIVQGGLGVIEDDDPAMLELVVEQRRNPDSDELATQITIEGTLCDD